MLLVGIVVVNVSAEEVSILGDANGDGKVSTSDIIDIINSIAGITSNDFREDLVDMNDDGMINIDDVIGVLNILTGTSEAKARPVDTLRIIYRQDTVKVGGSFNQRRIQTIIHGKTLLNVITTGKRPFVCIVEGTCLDGGLFVDADTVCTMILNNLQLSSATSAPLCFLNKQKVNIELSKESNSYLCDAESRSIDDESFTGCLYSKGTLVFTGKGNLAVTGNYRHGIVSSKNISVEGSHLIINNVVKNGIHCDKFTLKKGQIDLHLQNAASKGIKTKEELVVKGGTIEGEASGGITIEGGGCVLLRFAEKRWSHECL